MGVITPSLLEFVIKQSVIPQVKNALSSLSSVKQDKPTVISTTLLSSGWSDGEYSFETTYPSSRYDMTVEPNGDTITSSQLEAWSSSQSVGSAAGNKIICMGDVPEVDIPVIIKVVKK